MARDVKPSWMVKHGLGKALFEAYRSLEQEDPRCFLQFAVFNPDMPTQYIVASYLVIPKHADWTTLGVECDALLNPIVVFEWFARGSDFQSRWEKIEAFRAIPSLQQYVAVIAREKPYVEQHTRTGDQWELKVLTSPDDHVELVDREKKVPLSAMFEDVWEAGGSISMRTD